MMLCYVPLGNLGADPYRKHHIFSSLFSNIKKTLYTAKTRTRRLFHFLALELKHFIMFISLYELLYWVFFYMQEQDIMGFI